jgi:diguanylate cyclase (GGDEF)-like protein/PAS domain S-box-containing protein
MPVAVHTSTHPLLAAWCAATACDNTGISTPHNTAKAASQAVKRCEERRENMPTSLAARPCEGLPLLPATQRPMTQPHAPTPPTPDGAHPPGTGTGAVSQTATAVVGQSADAALRREHDTLQLILDHAPIGIWLQDGTGKIAFVNKAFCGAMGIAEERFLAVDHYVELIPEAFREQCLASDAKALASDGISVTNQQLPFVDGQVHDLQVIKVVKRDADGKPTFLVGLSLDVTAEQARLKALTASEERLRMALAAANQAWFEVDVPTGRVTLSPEYAQLIGHDLLVQQTSDMALWQSQVHPDDVDHALGVFRRVVQQGGPLSADYRRATATGGWKWLRSIGKVAERDAAGNALRVVGIHTDISVLKAHEQQLEHMAHYDALTGLPNRVLLADRLRQAMAHTARQGQRLAVVYLDLDGFKTVNDTHGHAMGDRLLATLAQRMQTALREGDTVCRLGGDEFVAVMLDVPDADAINPLLARLMGATTAPVTLDGQTLIPAASVGVTFYPQATEVDGDQLLRQADHAMYQAKQAGTNSHAVFDTVSDQDTRQRLDTLTRLRQALQDDEFVLHFQPKVHMGTGQVVGLEALVRWQHPTRGLLPPAQFLPVLQGHPLSIDLGNWVLATAIAQAASWRDNGLQLPVSINIDGYHLQHPDFVEHLRQVLARHPQLRPGDVELEVLESSAIEDLTRANAVMTQCAALGVGFALDDFGTGYASLTYLRRLPAGLLKIDQTFVNDLSTDTDNQALLRGIMGLAVAFKRQVIAEGVETIAQGQMLLSIGCVLGQGFGIARPMPATDVPVWLASWQPDASWTAAVR